MGKLTGLRRADAAIVGTGLTGLLLGASLTAAGMSVAIVEAAEGASHCCAGLATLLCAPLFARIEAAHDATAAQTYAADMAVQLQALTASPLPYVQDTTVYAFVQAEGRRDLLERQHALLTRLGVPARIAPDAGGCPFPVALSLMLPGQAVVDIPRWMAALRASIQRKGGRIFTASPVIAVDATRICTAQGCVDAPTIILATGKPIGLRSRRLLGLLETRRMLRCDLTGSYPLHSCQQAADGHFALRPTGRGAVSYGDAGRAGTRHSPDALDRFLTANMPDWQQSAPTWSLEIYPLDGLPVIGALPGSRALCACGFSGHGVLGAMHAAQLLTRRILGRARPEDTLYAPERRIPKQLLRRALRRNFSLYSLNMMRRNAPACPHCRCRIRYSTAARRWECPYCGSSYTMLGHVISGPGMQPARLSVRQRPDI